MEAIVLNLQKHTDNSYILHTYTREYGRMQYLVYGSRSGKVKGKVNLGLFTPLAWVDIETGGNKNKSITTISSVNLHYVPENITRDVRRQCVALYVSEAVIKTLKHPMEDEVLFNYLTEVIKEIDLSDSILHIVEKFNIQFSEILGYGGEPIEELSDMKSVELLQEII